MPTSDSGKSADAKPRVEEKDHYKKVEKFHDGNAAEGPPRDHFVTAHECDECHQTTSWSRVDYSHTSGGYPGDHRGDPDCADCHRTNSATPSWPYAAFAPDCAALRNPGASPRCSKLMNTQAVSVTHPAAINRSGAMDPGDGTRRKSLMPRRTMPRISAMGCE